MTWGGLITGREGVRDTVAIMSGNEVPVTLVYSSLSDSDAEINRVRNIMASIQNDNDTSVAFITSSEDELLLTSDNSSSYEDENLTSEEVM